MCEEKKRRKRNEKIRKAGEARTEEMVREIVRRERSGREKIEENIRETEWREHLLDY